MADGISIGSAETSQQLNSLNDAIAGTTSALGADGALANKMEGITEKLNSVIQTEVTNLPTEIQKVLEALSVSTSNLDSLKKHFEDEAKEANAKKQKLADAAKTGKKDFKDNDVAKLPAEMSAGSLFLGGQLKLLLGEKSLIFAGIADIARTSDLIYKHITGEGSKKKDDKKGKGKDGKGAETPGLKHKGGGWEDLSKTLMSFAKAALVISIMTPVFLIGLVALKVAGKFMDSAAKLFLYEKDGKTAKNWKKEQNKLKEALKFTTMLLGLFKNLIYVALFCVGMLFIVLPAIIGVFAAMLFLLVIKLFANVATKMKLDKKVVINIMWARFLFQQLVLTMLFASLIIIFILPAILGIFAAIIFMLAFKLLSLIAGKLLGGVFKFLIVVVLMAIAMLFFAITLFIMTKVVTLKSILIAIVSLVAITLLLAIVALIGFGATYVLPFIAAFALACIFMALGFILFVLALKILSLVTIDLILESAEKMLFIGKFFLMFALCIPVFLIGMYAAIYLMIASVALFIGMLFLFLALFFLKLVIGSIEQLLKMPISFIPEGAPEWMGGLGAIAMIAIFFLGLFLLLPVLILAVVPAVLLAVTSILLLVGFLALSGAVAMAGIVANIFNDNENIKSVGLIMSLFFLCLIPAGLAALILLPFAVIFLAAAVILLVAFTALTGVIALAKVLAKGFSADGELGTKDKRKEVGDAIASVFGMIANKDLIKAALKVLFVGAPVLAASLMMLAIFSSIVGCYRGIKEIQEIQESLNPVAVGFVFKAVEDLAKVVERAADITKDVALRGLGKFRLGIGGVIEAINGIVDVIIKLANFEKDASAYGYEGGGAALIREACSQLQFIIREFFGLNADGTKDDSNPFSIMNVFGAIGKIKGGDLKTVNALAPLAEGLGAIVDLVIKVRDVNDVGKAKENMIEIFEFTQSLSRLTGVLTSGALKKGDTPRILKRVNEDIMPHIPTFLDKLQEISEKARGIDLVELQLQECLVTPLVDLGTKNIGREIDKISQSIGKLNRELSKMTRENGNVIGSLGNIGAAAILSLKGDSGGGSRGPDQNTNLLRMIEQHLRLICDATEENNKTENDHTSFTA